MSARAIIIAIKSVLFIGLSIVTVATAYGYRLDSSRGSIERMGIVDVDIAPSDARLFVNGKEVETSQGSAVLSLPLGRHTIRIEKAGFHPFEKEITVDTDLAIRLRTVYLVPLPAELAISGQTDAVQELAINETLSNDTPPRDDATCLPYAEISIGDRKVMHAGGTVTLDGNVICTQVTSFLPVDTGALIASEFALLLLHGETGTIQTVHRFNNRLRSIIPGPSEDHAFVATATDISLCNTAFGICTHVLHAPGTIARIQYDPNTAVLDVVASPNQHITARFSAWRRGFFGR